MTKVLHTILGANGATGKAVIQELQKRNLPIRAVGRRSQTSDIEYVSANILNAEETERAIDGSSHVYLCVGLLYNHKVWAEQWPILMENVIQACIKSQAVLIFLDNIYMYSNPLPVPFDENSAQNPTTKKGPIRKRIADMVLDSVKTRPLKAVIARAPDFYGPYANNSAFYQSFLDRMLQGKNPQSIAKGGVKHTYGNTTDIGRALVLLALDESTYGQVWHMPVGEPITIEEVTGLFNKVMGTSFQTKYISSWMLKILSLFIPLLKEVDEMLYQFNEPYIMSCEKFKAKFPEFKVTPHEEGIRAMVESFRK